MGDVTIEIKGRPWTIAMVERTTPPTSLPTDLGCCDRANRRIEIVARLPGASLVETVVHEVRHAQDPMAREDQIDREAREIVAALHALGLLRS